uniref:Uncharacterized protein n=1 Tax=viral metagenome TaxID=1070528 RepID=A0A6C0AZK8_9ZZZZ
MPIIMETSDSGATNGTNKEKQKILNIYNLIKKAFHFLRRLFIKYIIRKNEIYFELDSLNIEVKRLRQAQNIRDNKYNNQKNELIKNQKAQQEKKCIQDKKRQIEDEKYLQEKQQLESEENCLEEVIEVLIDQQKRLETELQEIAIKLTLNKFQHFQREKLRKEQDFLDKEKYRLQEQEFNREQLKYKNLKQEFIKQEEAILENIQKINFNNDIKNL